MDESEDKPEGHHEGGKTWYAIGGSVGNIRHPIKKPSIILKRNLQIDFYSDFCRMLG